MNKNILRLSVEFVTEVESWSVINITGVECSEIVHSIQGKRKGNDNVVLIIHSVYTQVQKKKQSNIHR